MEKNDNARVTREGRWLIVLAATLVLSSLGGTIWVFLNKDNFAKKGGRQLPPSAKPAPPSAQPAPPAAQPVPPPPAGGK